MRACYASLHEGGKKKKVELHLLIPWINSNRRAERPNLPLPSKTTHEYIQYDVVLLAPIKAIDFDTILAKIIRCRITVSDVKFHISTTFSQKIRHLWRQQTIKYHL